MTNSSFADCYRKAMLVPDSEVIRMRADGFEKLKAELTPQHVIELTRMLFGLPVSSERISWFVDTFAANDASFSLVENQRETGVLAACLLRAGLEQGDAVSGLAPLTASLGATRLPNVFPEFIAEARQALQDLAARHRDHSAPDSVRAKGSAKSRLSTEVEQYAQAPDLPKAAALFKLLTDEVGESSARSARQLSAVQATITDIKEQVDILWWYVGGWSVVFDCPFSELKPALAAAMVGRDLAGLTRSPVGPPAAPAILKRVLDGAGITARDVSINDAVDAVPPEVRERMVFGTMLGQVGDICPTLAAFQLSAEIGPSPNWHAAFEKAARVSPVHRIAPLAMAMQVYRESLLLAELDRRA